MDGTLTFPPVLGGLKFQINTIQITRLNGLDVAADFTLEKLELGASGWSLKDIEFSFDTIEDALRGSGTLAVPTFDLTASAELIEQKLDTVEFELSGIKIPIGNTPFYLIRILGGLENLTTPSELIIKAGIGIAGGAVIPISPDNELYLISADPLLLVVDLGGKVRLGGALNLMVPKEDITIEIPDLLTYNYSGFPLAKAAAEIDLKDMAFRAAAEIHLNLIILSFDGEFGHVSDAEDEFSIENPGFTVSMDGILSGEARGSLQVGNNVPFIGFLFDLLGSNKIDCSLFFQNEGAGTELSVFGYTAAVYIENTGSIHFGDNLSSITPSTLSGKIARVQALSPSAYQVVIHEPVDWAVIQLTWNESNTHFDVRTPDGSVLTPAIGIDPAATRHYVRNTSAKRALYAMKQPKPGIYEIQIENPERIGDHEVNLLIPNRPPRISRLDALIDPEQEQTVDIEWEAFDEDDDAIVDLFYDIDSEGVDGLPIVQGLLEKDGLGKYQWSIDSHVAAGIYFIYARIRDGKNASQFYYCSKPIMLEPTSLPPTPQHFQAYIQNGTVVTQWEPVSNPTHGGYRIYYSTSEDSSHFPKSTAVGNEIHFTMTEIKPGIAYRMVVVSYDQTGRESLPSSPQWTMLKESGDSNALRIISHPADVVIAGQEYRYLPISDTIDTSELIWSLLDKPSGMKIDRNTGQITWKPSKNQTGTHSITLQVQNQGMQRETQSYSLFVRLPSSGNNPPQILSNPNRFFRENVLYEYQVIAFDPDDDPFQFELIAGPEGMSINENGLLQWPVSAFTVDQVFVQLIVRDEHDAVNQWFTLEKEPLLNIRRGDFNQDGVINWLDYFLFGQSFYTTNSHYDFNFDQRVDHNDLIEMMTAH